MRGYGRDYDDGRNWFERAGDTVRGWLGGGHDYDRDYGAYAGGGWDRGGMGARGDWNRGGEWRGGMDGYRTNNWSNTRSSREAVDRAGGYYGADYDRGTSYANDRDRGADRDRGHDWDRGGYYTGMGRGMDRGREQWSGRGMEGYDRDYGFGWGGGMGGGERATSGGMSGERGVSRGMGGRGMEDGMGRGNLSAGGMGARDTWMGRDYDEGGATSWGDYGRGFGRDRWRSSGAGGVNPGQYFRGYGNGSTGGSGYEPL